MNKNEENNNSCDEFEENSSDGDSRRVFLLTYSQADLDRFPTCKEFSDTVIAAFEKVKSSRKVKEWACCQEKHVENGVHYHMAISLDGTRRWKPIKNLIYENDKISINFATKNCGYVAAYRYVCKNKSIEEVLHSTNHSNLKTIGTPKTAKAMRRYSEGRREKRKSKTNDENCNKSSKIKRLSNSDVASLMVAENIRTENGLMRLAYQRNENGESDLQNFILNKSRKALSDLVATTWQIQIAPTVAERQNKPRLQIVCDFAREVCNRSCNGIWYQKALGVLKNNGVNKYVFAHAIREAIDKGRRKNNNVLIVGPTNCGKSFLLNPLEIVFKAFVNPATGRYAWIGLDECEVAYLNDFRWSPEIIAWNDFLLLLEGQTVHLPRPKNQFATDISIDRKNTIPFFATSKSDIEFTGKYNQGDQRETAMMATRWLTFRFSKQIEKPEFIEPCAKCFCKLVMEGADD